MSTSPHTPNTPVIQEPSRLQDTSNWLITNILPLGWLALATGMFWIGDRAYYHKLYYLLLAAPTFLAIALQPRLIGKLLHSPLLAIFILFSLYTLLTLNWSSTDNALGSLAKRPAYILLLLLSAGLLAMASPERLMQSLKGSAYIATIAALVSIALFVQEGADGRLPGYGALYNPLLTSHVFGAFMSMWLAYWCLGRSHFEPATIASIILLGILIIATGSRTPLVALIACCGWLALITWKKRSLFAVVIATLILGLIALLIPELSTSRGTSYRPEIWQETLRMIQAAPWLGHGYDAPFELWVAGLNFGLADPHNMLLAVLYYCGTIGLALWLAMYGIALSYAWRNSHDPLTVIASAMLVFGFTATLTEGGAFISRPKEHWFLIWIPMALIYAASLRQQQERGQ